MIRDDEITRLIKYAEALGLKIIYAEVDGCAEWTLDGTEIRINPKRAKIKTDLVLTLIHELAHHVWFIHKKERQPELKFEEALTRENLYLENKKSMTPKKLRKTILTLEVEGAAYWDIIIKDTNIKLPSWKINLAKEFDLWQYEYYYEHGNFPNRVNKRLKNKELVKKYKGG